MTGLTLQQKLADKLWNTLFGREDSAQLTPWQLRQSGEDHAAVRNAELSVIEVMLRDLDALQKGLKRVNSRGELVAVEVDELSTHVKLNPLIERASADPLDYLRVPSLSKALEGVRQDVGIRALKQALNVRRVGLRADLLAETLPIENMSERVVDADWLLRWQDYASRAIALDFQDMWAHVLVDEVRQPGTHCLRTLAFLSSVSKADMTTIRLMTRLDLQGFICREASNYFNATIHEPMFAQMMDMGLLYNDAELLRIKSVTDKGFRAVLRCHTKALYIEGEGKELAIQAHRFTPLGRRIVSIFSGNPDTGYLFALGNALKKRGYRIDIGDWLGQSGGGGLFSEKMSL
jgi:hypothetical protein